MAKTHSIKSETIEEFRILPENILKDDNQGVCMESAVLLLLLLNKKIMSGVSLRTNC